MKHKLSSRSVSVRALASGLAAVYFFTNVAAVHAGERGFWNDRRRVADVRRQSSAENAAAARQATLYAALPASAAPRPDLTPLWDAATKPAPVTLKSVGQSSMKSAADPRFTALARAVAPFGHIRRIEAAKTPGAPLVVHIQDVHGNPEAQKNMADMVMAVSQEPWISLVGLEGATGPLSADGFRPYPDQDIVKRAAGYFLEKDFIGGPEYAGLASEKPLTLWGVEDPVLYQANVDAVRASLAARPEAEGFLADLSAILDGAKARLYGDDLLAYDKNQTLYEQDRRGLGEYVETLKSFERRSPRTHETASPNINRLLAVLKQERALNFSTVESERRSLLESLASKLSVEDLKDLVRQSVDLKSGRMSHQAYQTYLRTLCGREGLTLDRYPQLVAYLRYVAESETIQRDPLLDELHTLEVSAQDALAATPDQRALVELSRDVLQLKKLFANDMTAPEWTSYNERRQAMDELKNRFLSAAAKTDPRAEKVPWPADWAKFRAPFEAFCARALDRNAALTDRLMAKMAEGKQTAAFLVAGGFHTDGLTAQLVQRGASVVVVTPALGPVDPDQHYLDVFAQGALPVEKIFSGEPISLKTVCGLAGGMTNRLHALIAALILSREIPDLKGMGDKPRTILKKLRETLVAQEQLVPALAEIKPSVQRVSPVGDVSLSYATAGGGRETVSVSDNGSETTAIGKKDKSLTAQLSRLWTGAALATTRALSLARSIRLPSFVGGTTPTVASPVSAGPSLLSWREEWAIAVRESLLILNPVFFFFRHDWKGGAQKTIGALLIFGLVLVMGETAELVMSGFAHFGLGQSGYATLMAYFIGWSATIPAHQLWNFSVERVNRSLLNLGFRFQFPRLTVKQVSDQTQIDQMAELIIEAFNKYQKDELTEEQLQEYLLKILDTSDLPDRVKEVIRGIGLSDGDKLIDIFRSPKSFLGVAHRSEAYSLRQLEHFQTGQLTFDEYLEAFDSALNGLDFPLIQDTQDLNPGTGGISFIYGGKVEGEEAILKWDKNRDGLKGNVDLVKNLEPFGGPRYLGLFRVVDSKGVWRTAIGLERIEGQSVLGLFRLMKKGEPLPFPITSAHLEGLRTLIQELTSQGKHLSEVNAGDIMLTPNAARTVVPLDMSVNEGVSKDAGLVAPGFSVSDVDGTVSSGGVEAPMEALIKELVNYSATGNVVEGQDLSAGIDRISNELVDKYGDQFIFLIHQTDAGTAKRLVEDDSTVFGVNGLNGTVLIAGQDSLRAGMRAVSKLETSAIQHKGSNSLLVMAVPRQWIKSMGGKFTLPNLDDYLIDQTESDASFINPNGGFGLPHKYIVGSFSGGEFRENERFVGFDGAASASFTLVPTLAEGRAKLFAFLGWRTEPESPALNWMINRGIEIFYAPFSEREASRTPWQWFKDHRFSGIQRAVALVGLVFIVAAVPVAVAAGLSFGVDISFMEKVLVFAFFGAGYWKFRDIGMIAPHMVWNVLMVPFRGIFAFFALFSPGFRFAVPVYTLADDVYSEMDDIISQLKKVRSAVGRISQALMNKKRSGLDVGDIVTDYFDALDRLMRLQSGIKRGLYLAKDVDIIQKKFTVDIQRAGLLVSGAVLLGLIENEAVSTGRYREAHDLLGRMNNYTRFLTDIEKEQFESLPLELRISAVKSIPGPITGKHVLTSASKLNLSHEQEQWLRVYVDLETAGAKPSFQLMELIGNQSAEKYEKIWKDGMSEFLSGIWSGGVESVPKDTAVSEAFETTYGMILEDYPTEERFLAEFPTVDDLAKFIAEYSNQPLRLARLWLKFGATQKEYLKKVRKITETTVGPMKLDEKFEGWKICIHPKAVGVFKTHKNVSRIVRELAKKLLEGDPGALSRGEGYSQRGILRGKWSTDYQILGKRFDAEKKLVILWFGTARDAHEPGNDLKVNQDVEDLAFQRSDTLTLEEMPVLMTDLSTEAPPAATIPAVENLIGRLAEWLVKQFPNSNWAKMWQGLNEDQKRDRIIRVYAPFVESFGLGAAYWILNALAPAVLAIIGFDPGLWFGNRLDVGLYAVLNAIFGAMHTQVYRPGPKPGEWVKGPASWPTRFGIMTTALFIHSPLLISILNPVLAPFSFIVGNLLAALLTGFLHRLYNDAIAGAPAGQALGLVPLTMGNDSFLDGLRKPTVTVGFQRALAGANGVFRFVNNPKRQGQESVFDHSSALLLHWLLVHRYDIILDALVAIESRILRVSPDALRKIFSENNIESVEFTYHASGTEENRLKKHVYKLTFKPKHSSNKFTILVPIAFKRGQGNLNNKLEIDRMKYLSSLDEQRKLPTEQRRVPVSGAEAFVSQSFNPDGEINYRILAPDEPLLPGEARSWTSFQEFIDGPTAKMLIQENKFTDAHRISILNSLFSIWGDLRDTVPLWRLDFNTTNFMFRKEQSSAIDVDLGLLYEESKLLPGEVSDLRLGGVLEKFVNYYGLGDSSAFFEALFSNLQSTEKFPNDGSIFLLLRNVAYSFSVSNKPAIVAAGEELEKFIRIKGGLRTLGGESTVNRGGHVDAERGLERESVGKLVVRWWNEGVFGVWYFATGGPSVSWRDARRLARAKIDTPGFGWKWAPWTEAPGIPGFSLLLQSVDPTTFVASLIFAISHGWRAPPGGSWWKSVAPRLMKRTLASLGINLLVIYGAPYLMALDLMLPLMDFLGVSPQAMELIVQFLSGIFLHGVYNVVSGSSVGKSLGLVSLAIGASSAETTPAQVVAEKMMALKAGENLKIRFVDLTGRLSRQVSETMNKSNQGRQNPLPLAFDPVSAKDIRNVISADSATQVVIVLFQGEKPSRTLESAIARVVGGDGIPFRYVRVPEAVNSSEETQALERFAGGFLTLASSLALSTDYSTIYREVEQQIRLLSRGANLRVLFVDATGKLSRMVTELAETSPGSGNALPVVFAHRSGEQIRAVAAGDTKADVVILLSQGSEPSLVLRNIAKSFASKLSGSGGIPVLEAVVPESTPGMEREAAMNFVDGLFIHLNSNALDFRGEMPDPLTQSALGITGSFNATALGRYLQVAYQHGRLDDFEGFLGEMLPSVERDLDGVAQETVREILLTAQTQSPFVEIQGGGTAKMKAFRSPALPGIVLKVPRKMEGSGKAIDFARDILPGYELAKNNLGGLFFRMLAVDVEGLNLGEDVQSGHVIVQQETLMIADANDRFPPKELDPRFKMYQKESFRLEYLLARRGVFDPNIGDRNRDGSIRQTPHGRVLAFDDVEDLRELLSYSQDPENSRWEDIDSKRMAWLLSVWETGGLPRERVEDPFDEVKKAQTDFLDQFLSRLDGSLVLNWWNEWLFGTWYFMTGGENVNWQQARQMAREKVESPGFGWKWAPWTEAPGLPGFALLLGAIDPTTILASALFAILHLLRAPPGERIVPFFKLLVPALLINLSAVYIGPAVIALDFLAPFLEWLGIAPNTVSQFLTGIFLHGVYNAIVASPLGRKMKLLPLTIGGGAAERRGQRQKVARDDSMMKIIAWLGERPHMIERVHRELMVTFNQYGDLIGRFRGAMPAGRDLNSNLLTAIWMRFSKTNFGVANSYSAEFMEEIQGLGAILDDSEAPLTQGGFGEVRVIQRPNKEKWVVKWTKYGGKTLTLVDAIGRIVSLLSEEEQMRELNSVEGVRIVPELKQSWVVRGRNVLAIEMVSGKHPGDGNKKLTLKEAVGILRAVRDFHAQGKVHGDLKPANIVLGESGAILIDLGATKNKDVMNVFNELQASPKYAAPDIAIGTSPGTDIYAVARLLIDLLPAYLIMDKRIFPLLERAVRQFDAPVDVVEAGIALTSFRPTAQELLTAFEEVLNANPEGRTITAVEQSQLDSLLNHMSRVQNFLQLTVFHPLGDNRGLNDASSAISTTFSLPATLVEGRARLFALMGWRTAPASPLLNWFIDRGIEVLFAPYYERSASRDLPTFFSGHKFKGIEKGIGVIGLTFIVLALPVSGAWFLFSGGDVSLIGMVYKVVSLALFGAGYWHYRDIGMIPAHAAWNLLMIPFRLILAPFAALFPQFSIAAPAFTLASGQAIISSHDERSDNSQAFLTVAERIRDINVSRKDPIRVLFVDATGNLSGEVARAATAKMGEGQNQRSMTFEGIDGGALSSQVPKADIVIVLSQGPTEPKVVRAQVNKVFSRQVKLGDTLVASAVVADGKPEETQSRVQGFIGEFFASVDSAFDSARAPVPTVLEAALVDINEPTTARAELIRQLEKTFVGGAAGAVWFDFNDVRRNYRVGSAPPRNAGEFRGFLKASFKALPPIDKEMFENFQSQLNPENAEIGQVLGLARTREDFRIALAHWAMAELVLVSPGFGAISPAVWSAKTVENRGIGVMTARTAEARLVRASRAVALLRAAGSSLSNPARFDNDPFTHERDIQMLLSAWGLTDPSKEAIENAASAPPAFVRAYNEVLGIAAQRDVWTKVAEGRAPPPVPSPLPVPTGTATGKIVYFNIDSLVNRNDNTLKVADALKALLRASASAPPGRLTVVLVTTQNDLESKIAAWSSEFGPEMLQAAKLPLLHKGTPGIGTLVTEAALETEGQPGLNIGSIHLAALAKDAKNKGATDFELWTDSPDRVFKSKGDDDRIINVLTLAQTIQNVINTLRFLAINA